MLMTEDRFVATRSVIRRFERDCVVNAWLTGKALKRGLTESGLHFNSDSFKSFDGLVVIDSGHVHDNLNVGPEPGERLLGHAHTVQHTAWYVKEAA
jgi:hypothetical protein